MPVPIEAYARPELVKMRTRYPMTEDKKDRFPDYANDYKRSWKSESGWKQGGYNPNHQSTRVEKVNLTTDEITLRPY